LLVLNVSAYYSTVAEGTILILAVLAGSLNRDSQLARQIRHAVLRISARRQGLLPGQRSGEPRMLRLPGIAATTKTGTASMSATGASPPAAT